MNNKKNFIILLSLIIVAVIVLFFYFLMNKKDKVAEKNYDNVNFSELVAVDEKGNTNFNPKNLSDSLVLIDKSDLSDLEKAGLVYMREEEKLAHDVYVVLFGKFGQTSFDNISKSEQTHTEAVKSLLERYNLEDPSLNKVVGDFENADLKALYIELLKTLWRWEQLLRK